MSSLIQLKYMAFHYVITCFKCIIISRTEYSFLSKQSAMSVRKTAGFTFINWIISKMVWDSESYKAGALCDNSYEDKGGFENKPGMSHLQPDQPKIRGHAPSSSFSSKASDEEEIFQSGPYLEVQTPSILQ
jgi:hypothetical protein